MRLLLKFQENLDEVFSCAITKHHTVKYYPNPSRCWSRLNVLKVADTPTRRRLVPIERYCGFSARTGSKPAKPRPMESRHRSSRARMATWTSCVRCSARTGSKPTKPICEAPIKAMALLLHILGERGTGCAAPRLPRLEHHWVSPTPKKEAGGGRARRRAATRHRQYAAAASRHKTVVPAIYGTRVHNSMYSTLTETPILFPLGAIKYFIITFGLT